MYSVILILKIFCIFTTSKNIYIFKMCTEGQLKTSPVTHVSWVPWEEGTRHYVWGKSFFLEILKPGWIPLLLCNSQWHPSIHLIGWLSRYISDVGRQNTSESLDWARAIEAVRSFFYMALYIMSRSLLSGNPGYMSNRRRSLIESVSRHYVWGTYKIPPCEKTVPVNSNIADAEGKALRQ